MSEEDYVCEPINQGNINFVIIKNSASSLTPAEYVEEALDLCGRFDLYSNLNMNVIFIHNILSNEEHEKEKEDINEDKDNVSSSETIKLKNSNINILLLKNIISRREG